MKKNLAIDSIRPDSPADRAGICRGELLVSINGSTVRDIIDYSWLVTDEEPELVISAPDGTLRTILLELYPGESPGLSFAPPKPRRCGNNCIFCFVHQLPGGLRRQLYVKDEDYRLSFLHGTYVTLTNIRKPDIARIISQRLSPLYVSVHTTDTGLRELMLGRRGIPPVMSQLRRLSDAGIRLHTQIVLCPGINDGANLSKTVDDLASLHPSVQSLAIVPLGLTAHRKNLPELRAVDSAYSSEFLGEWLPYMRRINREMGDAFLQLADEFFIKSGTPFPKLKEYGDLPQWENGVGMVPCFLKEASSVLKKAKPLKHGISVTVPTGESSFAVVDDFLRSLGEKTFARLNAVAIPNLLFGKSVTVTGLVSGADIIDAMKGLAPGDAILLPDVMLKEGEGLFLDNLSVSNLSEALGVHVTAFNSSPAGFYSKLLSLSERL